MILRYIQRWHRIQSHEKVFINILLLKQVLMVWFEKLLGIMAYICRIQKV